MKLLGATLLYLTVLCQALLYVESRKLIQVNVIWRHGDRSSRYTYPNDPYKDVWQDGPFQLTDQGIKQEYEMGVYLHSRYPNLLRSKYKEGEIFVKSTDTDRTIMSAQSVISGLYSRSNESKWEGIHTPWRPFPIHVESQTKDWLYQVQYDPEKGCKNYDILREKLKFHEWFKKNERDYSQFYKSITEFTGQENTYDIYSAGQLYDNLFCLKSNGYKLPSWATEEVMRKLEYLSDMLTGLQWTDINYEYKKAISRMRSGVILNHMLDSMRKRVDGTTNYSFIGYSAHDSTLGPLLVSMGAFNWKRPPYSACIMLELHQEDNSNYSVEFWYKNSSHHEPYPLSFYDCGAKCSFPKFEKIALDLLPGKDLANLCGHKSEANCCTYLLVGVIVFIMASILFLIVRRVLAPEKRKEDYRIVPLHDNDSDNLMKSSVF